MGQNSKRKRKRDKRRTKKQSAKIASRPVAYSRPTLALAMIMKDEISDLERIIHDYEQYFDKIYVTVTDEKTYNKLQKNPPKSNKLELSYFKWIDHFGKARRYNQKQVKTDYWMWIDLDDEIEGADSLPIVMHHMLMKKIDAVWFKYNYVRKLSNFEPETILWRERIIKTSSGLSWKDEPVHEYISMEGKIVEEYLTDITIKHRKTIEETSLSGERNRLILEEDWSQSQRPVTAMYLGSHYRIVGKYQAAIKKLLFVSKNGDSDIQKFNALQNLCECYFKIGNYNKALDAAEQSIAIDSNHPEPWYQKYVIYSVLENPKMAMESAEKVLNKKVQGKTEILTSQDPTRYEYKIPFEIAQSYLAYGNHERARQIYKEVKKIAPEYIGEVNAETGTDWNAVFERVRKDKSVMS